MANQITINIGAAANDGTGDPLRTAFNDVNLNFANVWNTGLPNSNIQFSDNRILTVNTNANLVLAPNGIGKVASNVDIVPNTNNVFNLGSPTRYWNMVYTQYLTVGSDFTLNGDLSVGGNLTVTGNIIEMGNIVTDAKTIQLANTANTTSAANGSGITVGASDNIATLLYNSTNNIWTTNIGLSATGNITAPYFIGNGSQLTGITAYANANAVAYGQAGWAGNIIPSGNAVYSLGNATNQWKSLYVSNTTIYLNNVPIGLTSGNVLTVNGQDVVTTTSNGVTSLGNIGFVGDAVYDLNGMIIENADLSHGATAAIIIPANGSTTDPIQINNTYGNLVIGTGPSGTVASNWTFDNTGNLNLPFTGALNLDDGPIVQSADRDLHIIAQDVENDGWGSYLEVTDGTSVHSQLTQKRDQFQFGLGLTTGPAYYWQFNDSGATILPGNIDGPYGESINIRIPGASANSTVSLRTIDNSDTLRSNVTVDISNVTVSTGSGAYTWKFDNTGTMSVPNDGTITTPTVGSGLGGQAITIQAGSSDQTTWNSNPGGTLNLRGGYGSFNDGYGAIGGPVNIYGGLSPENNSGNVNIFTGNISQYQWSFNNNGYLNLPANGDFAHIQTGNNKSLTIETPGDTLQRIQITPADGVKIYANNDAHLWQFDNNGTLTAPGNISAGNFIGGGSNVDIVAGSYTWTFDTTGNTTMPAGTVSMTNLDVSGTTSLSNTATITTSDYAIGYRDIPQLVLGSNTTAALTDAGKHYYSTTAGNIALTLPDNSNVAFPTGATLTVVVNAAGNVLVNQGTGVTLYMAGSSTTGNRAVGAYGLASVMKVAANTWVISGTGVY